MKLLGTRLTHQRDVGARPPAILRLVITHQHLYLGHAVLADRNIGRVPQPPGVQHHAVHGHAVRVVAVPLDVYVPSPGEAVHIRGGIDHARQQGQQRHHVPALGQEFFDLVGRHDAGALAAGGLHLRALRGDGNRFRQGAHRQHQGAHGQLFGGAQHQAGTLDPLEAGRLGGQHVLARRQVAEDEVPLRVGLNPALGAGSDLTQRQSNTGYRQIAGIHDRAYDGPGDRLRAEGSEEAERGREGRDSGREIPESGHGTPHISVPPIDLARPRAWHTRTSTSDG